MNCGIAICVVAAKRDEGVSPARPEGILPSDFACSRPRRPRDSRGFRLFAAETAARLAGKPNGPLRGCPRHSATQMALEERGMVIIVSRTSGAGVQPRCRNAVSSIGEIPHNLWNPVLLLLSVCKRMAKGKEQPKPRSARIVNRKARYDFEILEVVECGMELLGTEVKSLRAGTAKLEDAYGRIRGGQVFLVGASISAYPHAAGAMQHEPMRDRRLLLRRRQIHQLETHVRQKGKTLVPLAVYFKRGYAKVELGVAVGKRHYDKRESIRKREQQREMQRAIRRRR